MAGAPEVLFGRDPGGSREGNVRFAAGSIGLGLTVLLALMIARHPGGQPWVVLPIAPLFLALLHQAVWVKFRLRRVRLGGGLLVFDSVYRRRRHPVSDLRRVVVVEVFAGGQPSHTEVVFHFRSAPDARTSRPGRRYSARAYGAPVEDLAGRLRARLPGVPVTHAVRHRARRT